VKFRKKPVVIEATQWFKNGDHPDDYGADRGVIAVKPGAFPREHDGEGAVVRHFRRSTVSGERACEHCGVRMHEHGWIDTKEGGHIVCPGDWIVTGVQGERYPVKPDIFTATYEPITAPDDDTGQG
jgi:hypothetical protein